MRESEFITSADGKTQIDTGCLTGSQKTVIFPLDGWVQSLHTFMVYLDNLNNALEDKELLACCASMLEDFVETYLNLRRAWVHGYDVPFNMHPNSLYTAFLGCCPDIALKTERRIVSLPSGKKGKKQIVVHELPFRTVLEEMVGVFSTNEHNGASRHVSAQARLKKFLKEFAADLSTALDDNYYMSYELSFGSSRTNRETRRIAVINHVGDWRVLAWTNSQIETLANSQFNKATAGENYAQNQTS